MIKFHGSPTRIDRFWPLAHFGTQAAAETRLRQRGPTPAKEGYIHKAELSVENPVVLQDWGGNRSRRRLCVDVLRRLGIESERALEIGRGGAFLETTIDYLRDQGHDGISYSNEVEDPGSLSYVILRPPQVSVIEVWHTSTPSGSSRHE